MPRAAYSGLSLPSLRGGASRSRRAARRSRVRRCSNWQQPRAGPPSMIADLDYSDLRNALALHARARARRARVAARGKRRCAIVRVRLQHDARSALPLASAAYGPVPTARVRMSPPAASTTSRAAAPTKLEQVADARIVDLASGGALQCSDQSARRRLDRLRRSRTCPTFFAASTTGRAPMMRSVRIAQPPRRPFGSSQRLVRVDVIVAQ